MESVPGFCVAFDRDHTPIYWNDAFERLTVNDQENAPLQDRTLDDLFPVADEEAIRSVLENGSRQQTHMKVRNRSGQINTTDVTISPIHNFDREVIGFIVVGEVSEGERLPLDQVARTQEPTVDSILNTLPDVLYLFDEEGNMLKWNDRLNELTEYSDREISQMSPLNFTPNEDEEKIVQALEAVFSQHEIQRVTSHLVTKSGNKIPHEFIGGPLLDDQGELIGLVGTGRDLRDQKQAEDKLKSREDLFRSLVQAVEDYAIFRLTPQGQIKSWNRGAQEIKGYSRDEILGKHIAIFYPDEYLEENLPQRLLNEARKKGRAEHEGWRLRKDGSRFWANVVITAIYDGDELMGFSKVTHDLTERKNRKDELKQRHQELEAIKKQLEERVTARTEELEKFLYAVSHDLREPLRQISHYTDFLRDDLQEENDELSETVQEDLDFLTDAAGRMQNLIKGLLRLSRVGRRDLEREVFDPEEAVDAALKNLDREIEKHNPEVIMNDLPSVRADRDLLTNLYQNLISNALKYSDSDQPTLTLTGQSRDDAVVLGVKDDGIGIDPEHQDRIFEPFRQLQDWENQKGTGIGLSLCKRIVKRHDGSIWVESSPGQGSHFQFSLPGEGSVVHDQQQPTG
jgi:PAS domain S-box-containing protein